MVFKKKRHARHMRYAKKARYHSRGMSMGGLMPLVAAGLYGAGRGYISNSAPIKQLNSMLPLGTLSDNVVMLGVNWAAKKYVPIGIVKQAAGVGMYIEAAMIGAELASGTAFGSGSTSSW